MKKSGAALTGWSRPLLNSSLINMKALFGIVAAMACLSAEAYDAKKSALAASVITHIEQTLREARDNHDISEQLYQESLAFVHDNQCDAINRAFVERERSKWSAVIAARRNFAGATAVQSFVDSSWRIVYATFPNSEPAFFFYSKSRAITTWSGGAAIFDAPEIEKWVLENAPGIPKSLAHCFAWHVTFNRDQ